MPVDTFVAASPARPAARTQASAQPILVPGRNCWRIEPRRGSPCSSTASSTSARCARHCDAAERSIFILGWDIDSRMRLCPGGARRRLARAARRFPQRAGEGAPATARLRAFVGLRDALPGRARVAADLQARHAHASATVVPPRRPTPGRRLAPPEGGRRRRQRGIRQRLRPHALALGHDRARPRRPAAAQPVRPRLRAVPRRRRRRSRANARARSASCAASAGSARPAARPRPAASAMSTGAGRSVRPDLRTCRWRSRAPSRASSDSTAAARSASCTSTRSPPLSAISSPRTSTSPRARSPTRWPRASSSREVPRSRSCRRRRKAAGSKCRRWACCARDSTGT